MTASKVAGATAMMLLLCIGRLYAQAATPESIQWTTGPSTVALGSVGELSLPAGYKFTGEAGARVFMELTQNPSSGRELGIVVPDRDTDDMWFVVFQFSEIGYVKDDEKQNLDADAILRSIRKGTEAGNVTRRERGWEELRIDGWSRPPFYDETTQNLTWALSATNVGETSTGVVNYSVRILGRRGTIDADLVLEPTQLATTVPEFDALLRGLSYVSGERYSEWREGDAVAKYGLTALVAGGAGALAVKTGLLAKFWKLLVVGVVAAAAAVGRGARAIGRAFREKPTA